MARSRTIHYLTAPGGTRSPDEGRVPFFFCQCLIQFLMQPVFPGVPLDGILEHAGYTHVHSGVGFTSYGVSGVVNCTRQFILRFSLGNIVG